MSNPVEGWYPDPAGTPQLRWWDGYAWTDDYHPDDTMQDYGNDSYIEQDEAYTGYQAQVPTYASVPQAQPKAPAKQLVTTIILSLLIAVFTVGAIATTSLFLSANKEYKQAQETLNQANEDLRTVQGETK